MSDDVKLQRISDIRAGIMLDLNSQQYIASVVADEIVGYQPCDTLSEAQNWIGNRIKNHFNNDNLYAALTKDIEEVDKWKRENGE